MSHPSKPATASAKVLFDLSNIATGGALQVAASVFDEIGRIADYQSPSSQWPWLANCVVEASPAVLENATYHPSTLSVREVDGSPRFKLRMRRVRHDVDVSFMLFGPDYAAPCARTRIVGFADGTSLYPEFANLTGARTRARNGLRRSVSRSRFKQADLIVVEASHVAEALGDRWGLDQAKMRVVPNVLNAVFHDFQNQEPFPLPRATVPRFCFPTRLHPHKNLASLGMAAKRLRERHAQEVQFILTLTEDEWSRLDEDTQKVSLSVGALRISQLPSLYAACDGTIFPSLNECFSVTPLEALASGSPLLASDRSFVRDIAGDAAWYFEPSNPESIADTLTDFTISAEERERRRALGRAVAADWPTASSRAVRYLDIIAEAIG